jgi:hypothetical protein
MDRPATLPKSSRLITVLATAGVMAGAMVPVAAAGTWLLLTDPDVAAEAAARNSLMPVADALVTMLGRALAGLLAYL